MSNTQKIVIALSGGVDSSVAAYLVKKQHTGASACLLNSSSVIQGVFMNNWSTSDELMEDSHNFYCATSERDYQDALLTCNKLNIKLKQLNFTPQYWNQVFVPFLEGLEGGITPNPDVWCNSKIKFGVLKEFVFSKLGATKLVTGHYARVFETSSKKEIPDYIREAIEKDYPVLPTSLIDYITKPQHSIILCSGKDKSKDQSYFLCQTHGTSFQDVLFPIGEYMKNSKSINSEDKEELSVRKIAKDELGLETISRKKDSTGICFIGKRKFHSFLDSYIDGTACLNSTYICIDTGKIVGRHKGTKNILLTIGQNARIPGGNKKWFVVEKNIEKGIIFVCSNTHHPALYADELYVNQSDMNWISSTDMPPILKKEDNQSIIRVLCRTRHLQPLIGGEIRWIADRSVFAIKLDQPVRALTPGQIIALYVADGLICLGGGPILDRGLSYHERGMTLSHIDILPPSHNRERTASSRVKEWGRI